MSDVESSTPPRLASFRAAARKSPRVRSPGWQRAGYLRLFAQATPSRYACPFFGRQRRRAQFRPHSSDYHHRRVREAMREVGHGETRRTGQPSAGRLGHLGHRGGRVLTLVAVAWPADEAAVVAVAERIAADVDALIGEGAKPQMEPDPAADGAACACMKPADTGSIFLRGEEVEIPALPVVFAQCASRGVPADATARRFF